MAVSLLVHTSKRVEGCCGFGACIVTGSEVSEGAGEPEYDDEGDWELMGSQVFGSSWGCECIWEKDILEGPLWNIWCGATWSKGDRPTSCGPMLMLLDPKLWSPGLSGSGGRFERKSPKFWRICKVSIRRRESECDERTNGGIEAGAGLNPKFDPPSRNEGSKRLVSTSGRGDSSLDSAEGGGIIHDRECIGCALDARLWPYSMRIATSSCELGLRAKNGSEGKAMLYR